MAEPNAKPAEKKAKKPKPYKAAGKFCPKCGARMADHADRHACGKCGYTEWKNASQKGR